jgi:hypothetical protein
VLLAGIALLIVITLRHLPPIGHANPDQPSHAGDAQPDPGEEVPAAF